MGDRRQTQIRLPQELYDAIHTAASERAVGVNWIICRLLKEGIDRLVPVEEFHL